MGVLGEPWNVQDMWAPDPALYLPLHLSDTMDSVKQSAALCLLRLYKTSPDLVPMGEWTSRVVHLLNDQHMVCSIILSLSYFPFQ